MANRKFVNRLEWQKIVKEIYRNGFGFFEGLLYDLLLKTSLTPHEIIAELEIS